MTTANFYLGSLEKTASLVALWFVVRQPHVTCYVILCYAIFLTKKIMVPNWFLGQLQPFLV